MSRLKEKIEQASMSSPAPMGFRAAQKVCRPRMVIIARFGKGMSEDPSEFISGADAGLVEWSSAKTLKKMIKADAGIPWGVQVEEGDAGSLEEMVNAGADFLLFKAEDAPLSLAADEKTGKVLVTGLLPSDGWVRSLNKLPVDALFLSEQSAGEQKGFTWRQLMTFRYFSDMVAKPVLVPVPVDITEAELQAMWDAGVDGVVVRVEAGLSGGRMGEMRKMIDGLTPPSKRREKGAKALVPVIREESKQIIEQDEEEEDE